MMGPKEKSLTDLKPGDIVEVIWMDTQGFDRLSHEEVENITELTPTRSFGVYLKTMKTCIVIAHEVGDSQSDGNYVEQLPPGMILKVIVHGHTNTSLEDP